MTSITFVAPGIHILNVIAYVNLFFEILHFFIGPVVLISCMMGACGVEILQYKFHLDGVFSD